MASAVVVERNQVITTTSKASLSSFAEDETAKSNVIQESGVVDPKASLPLKMTVEAQPELLWSRFRHTLREPFSEFFGVFILILFGDGVVAQVVLSHEEKGNFQSISWGWG